MHETYTTNPIKNIREESSLESHDASLPESKKTPEKIRRQKIRTLNDVLRTSLTGGIVFFTDGIQGLDDKTFQNVLKKVQTFDTFTKENDPFEEHNFGIVEEGMETVYWKIDYYNDELTEGSEDPSDSSVTTRVMTIMLRSEY